MPSERVKVIGISAAFVPKPFGTATNRTSPDVATPRVRDCVLGLDNGLTKPRLLVDWDAVESVAKLRVRCVAVPWVQESVSEMVEAEADGATTARTGAAMSAAAIVMCFEFI